MDDKLDMTYLAAMLEEQLSALLEQILPVNHSAVESVMQWDNLEREGMRRMAEEILMGSGAIQSAPDSVSVNLISSPGKLSSRGEYITQNIYLRENDPSPYKTARAIRRESEAMLRI